MANSHDQLQSALQSRNQPQAAAAATSPVASFSDWQFNGSGSSVFVSVTITPTNSNDSITYALVLLQTPQATIICDGALATSNAGNNWALNIATGNDMYDVNQFGTSVQAVAFAQVYGVGEVWSPVQNYTVQP